MPSRVARWTMPYIAVALTFFVLAQVMMVAGWGLPVAPLQRPTLLVTVHFLTIGWLTILMFAALRQFVPVITAGRPHGDAFAPVALVLLVVGLVMMAGGFLNLGSPSPFGTLPLLPVGGTSVVVGAVMLALAVASTLWVAPSLALPARFVAAGLVGLLLTVALGLTMALARNQPQLFGARWLAAVLTQGLGSHVAMGLIAWFTLTAMGVGYKLMVMFTLAPEERGVLGNAAFALTVAGLVLMLATSLGTPFIETGASAQRVLAAAGRVAWLLALAGGATYLADVVFLYRQRRRRTLELNASFARWAFAALAASLVLMTAALSRPASESRPTRTTPPRRAPCWTLRIGPCTSPRTRAQRTSDRPRGAERTTGGSGDDRPGRFRVVHASESQSPALRRHLWRGCREGPRGAAGVVDRPTRLREWIRAHRGTWGVETAGVLQSVLRQRSCIGRRLMASQG